MARFAWLLVVLFAAFAGVGLPRLLPHEAPQTPAANAKPTPLPPGQPVGNVGCSAAACHGNPNAKALTERPGPDCWKASATIYHAIDPHRRAFDALKSELAEQIEKQLREKAARKIKAENDVRCLACHVNPSLAVPTANATLRSEGVSCEACHGDASQWLAPHTVGKGFGLSLLAEGPGNVCAGCHIGAPATGNFPVRDMNHDMIAAGHPALYGWPPYPGMKYEDASVEMIKLGLPALNADFHKLFERYPKHFRERQYQEAKPDPFVTALRIINDDRKARSQVDAKATPWPEFADGSKRCVDCHQVLTGKAAEK